MIIVELYIFWEETMPYIYGKTLVKKWLGTLVGFPILAAVLAGIMQVIFG